MNCCFIEPDGSFALASGFVALNLVFTVTYSIRLNQTLQWPFREVVATALFDFVPQEPNQLPLRHGCQVIVIGKEGDSKGWWRGKTMERVSTEKTMSHIC
jgi:hypothetical protein